MSNKIGWKRIMIITVLVLVLVVIIFGYLIIFDDLCWNAALAKGLNPDEMVYLTPEEVQAFGSVANVNKNNYLDRQVSVDFREHFRCHHFEKPITFGDYWSLYVARLRGLFSK